MSALGKLFRATAFKLSLVYLVVFTIFAFFLLGYVAWNTRRVLTDRSSARSRPKSRASKSSIASAACAAS